MYKYERLLIYPSFLLDMTSNSMIRYRLNYLLDATIIVLSCDLIIFLYFISSAFSNISGETQSTIKVIPSASFSAQSSRLLSSAHLASPSYPAHMPHHCANSFHWSDLRSWTPPTWPIRHVLWALAPLNHPCRFNVRVLPPNGIYWPVLSDSLHLS